MSLINEALKKAQKQRSGETPSLPSIGGEKPSQIARRGKPAGLNTLLIGLGLGLTALIALVVGGIFLFRNKADNAAPAATIASPAHTPAPQPAAPPPAPTPAVTVAATPAAPEASTFVVPNVSPSAPAPSRTESPAPKSEPVQPPTLAQVPAPVVEQPKPEPARPAAAAKLEPRAINFIEGIRVAGIRASTTDSKVLMNDRVYRLGDTVEHDMGLKLVSITPHSLTFEDDRGARYTRSF
jgi:hypothetical protein